MHFTWLPRYYPHVVASETQPLRFGLHAAMALAIVGVLALPGVRAWAEVDPWICLFLILVHLLCFGAEVFVGIYRRWPTLWSTVYVSWNLASAICIAVLPGKMIPTLWALYGIHIIYLTRAVTISPYLIALIGGGPLLGAMVSQSFGAELWTTDWPEIALVSVFGVTLYLSLAPSMERQLAALHAAKERERIAANLHDTVGSSLAEVVLWHELANADTGPRSDGALERARARTSEALLELRMAVNAMTTGEIEAAQLKALLHARVLSICDAAKVRAYLDFDATTGRLPGECGRHIVNLIAEAVTNAVRHGNPKRIDIKIGLTPLSIRIEDDGQGFEPRAARRGQGLASMRARASALGARLRVDSSPAKGTAIEVKRASRFWS